MIRMAQLLAHTYRAGSNSSMGFAFGILDLDLLAARSGLHVVPKTTGLLQRLDERW
jgi:hypothetical protein